MKKNLKFSLIGMTALLTLLFSACQQSADPEIKYVDKIVEKEVPTDLTSHDAVAVYHWKQNTDGITYSKGLYEENEDGTEKKDSNNISIIIETEKKIAAKTKLPDIAKTFYGFTAKGLVESQQADGTYIINVYYDRKHISINITGDITTTITGLYGSEVDLNPVYDVLPTGSYISSSDIPKTYPVENISCTANIKTLKLELSSKDGFIKIPHGSYKRSNESSLSKVSDTNTYTFTLTKDFYICDHEVTQGEWELYMTYYGEVINSDFERKYPNYTELYKPFVKYGKGKNFPVYGINWYEAVIYCNLLSLAKGLEPCYYVNVPKIDNPEEVERIFDPEIWSSNRSLGNKTLGEMSYVAKAPSGKFYYNATNGIESNNEKNIIFCDFTRNGYRLPTEAEICYAALGEYKDNENWKGYGKDGSGVFSGFDGSNADDIEKYVWFSSNGNNSSHVVKGKRPNSYGLYDMSGNVWEWCWDWSASGNYPIRDSTDPTGEDRNDGSRKGHGGSFRSLASKCEVLSHHLGIKSWDRWDMVGFRVVRTATETE